MYWWQLACDNNRIKPVYFDLPKKLDNSLKDEIDYIKEHNEFLSEQTMKNKITQLFSIYEHGDEIYKYGKQSNEWTRQIRS